MTNPIPPQDNVALQTEINRLQDINQNLQCQLTAAQKQSALGELVGTTTHEFNNVLMTIINYAKLGLRHDDPEMKTKAFTKILAGGERAAKITNSVLAMARNRSENFDMTCIETLIEESLILLEREMQRYRISLETIYDEVPMAPVIGNQIQQVLMNLLINARQAMSEGGRLILHLSHDEATNTVDISVRDFGTGIPQDQLRQIFEPYYTTKSGPDESGKGGTGLGLAACKNIIEAHGGKIRVESSVGKGTKFTLKLPMSRPDVRKANFLKSPAATTTGQAAASSPQSI